MKEREEPQGIGEERGAGADALGPEERFSLKKSIWDLCRVVGAALALFLALTCFFKPALTRGDSMMPTLRDGDRTIVAVYGYRLGRGDVIVLKDRYQTDKHLVKRVIALAGEQVDIDFDRGLVYINGLALEEPYCTGPTIAYDVEFPAVVPQGHLFVLGDNRGASHDSRSADVGMIPLDAVEGKVVWRFYPFDRLGVIR